MTQDKAVEQEVIDLSCVQSIASSYTSMVAYELTKKEHAAVREREIREGTEEEKEWMTRKERRKVTLFSFFCLVFSFCWMGTARSR